jgi:hypothetical protein
VSRQKGRNSGVTGLVDITGAPQFYASVYRLNQSLDVPVIDRTGRGDRWTAVRQLQPGGRVLVSGEVRSDGPPFPTNLRGATGSLTVIYHDTSQEVLTVSAEAHTINFRERDDDAGEDVWDVTILMRITAAPNVTGFGVAQVANPDPTFNTKQTYAGLTKQIDPGNLQELSTQRFDLEGLVDTDAAEVQAIVDLIAAAATPVTGHKLRSATFQRTDFWGGVVSLTWGLTNTTDDIQNPASVNSDDVTELQDVATIRLVTTSSTPPAPPAAPVAGTKHVSTDTVKLHDSAWTHTFHYGRRTTEDAVEFDNSDAAVDPTSLNDDGKITEVTNSATPPAVPGVPVAGTKHVRTLTVRIHDTRWRHTFFYGRRTSEDAVEMDGSGLEDDLTELTDSGTIRIVHTSSTPPAAPASPVAGAKHISTSVNQLHDTRWAITYRYGRRSSEDAVEMDGTQTSDDVGDLADRASIRIVTNSGTPPAVPGTPVAGAKHVSTDIVQLHDTRWAHTFNYGPRTTHEAVEMDGSIAHDDPTELGDSGSVTEVTESAIPPAVPPEPVTGTKHIGTESQQLRSGKWRHRFNFGRRTSEDAVEMDGSHTDDDVSDLSGSAEITRVTNSATPPADPGTPLAEIKLIRTVTKQLHDTRWAHTFVYGPRTTEDAVEMDGSVNRDDPSDLRETATLRQVTASSVPPAPPATPLTGTKHNGTDSQQLKDGKWSHTFHYGRRTSEDDVEMDGSFVQTDPGHQITDEAAITVVTAAAAPPAVPSNPIPDGAHVRTRTRQLHDTRWSHTFFFAMNTAAREIELRGTHERQDPKLLDGDATITDVTATSIPSPPAAPTGMKHVGTDTRQLNDVTWQQIYHYAYLDSEDRVEFGGTETYDDPQNLTDHATITVVHTSATPPATPGAPLATLKVVASRIKQLTPARWAHTFEYDVVDSKDKIELGETVASVTQPEANADDLSQVVTCLSTDTAKSLADAYFAANKNTATFFGVEVKKLTPTIARRIIKTRNLDRQVFTRGFDSQWDYVKSDGNNVMVSQVQVVGQSGGTTLKRAIITPISVFRTVGTVVLRRLLVRSTGETSVEDSLTRLSKRGLVNDAPFLGFGTGRLIYVGPGGEWNFAIQGARVFIVDYIFRFDSLGHFGDGQFSLGPVLTTGNVPLAGGFVSKSVFGWEINPATPGPFADFLAA